MATDRPTEIAWEVFCDLYVGAREADDRRLDQLPDRYLPGEGVIIPIIDRAADDTYLARLFEEQDAADD